VNNNYRDKGIFKELMNYVANYSNKMNVKYIIFKIDRIPIPSFYEYNFTSNYYYMTHISNLFKNGNIKQIDCHSINNSKNIIISCSINNEYYRDEYFEDEYFGIEKIEENLGVSPFKKGTENLGVSPFKKGAKNLGVSPFKKGAKNLGVSPFFKGATTMIFKRNSPESIELLYIYKPNKKNIYSIIGYLHKNYSFDFIFVDDIGNNSEVIKVFPESFKLAYPVYHYILGLKEIIEKQNFFYYF
jgi:hypothetical protein